MFIGWYFIPSPVPTPPPPAVRWLVYGTPILETKTTSVGDVLRFTLDICNNSGGDLTNVGSFIWVRENVTPPEYVTTQALSNSLAAGCSTRKISVPLPVGVIPGLWHYEGHVCPINDSLQCSNFKTDRFEVVP